MHFDALELRVRGQVFPLTLMEANVLALPDRSMRASRCRARRMLEEVWGLHEDTDTRADRQLHRAAAPLYRRRSHQAAAPADGARRGLPVRLGAAEGKGTVMYATDVLTSQPICCILKTVTGAGATQ